MTDAARPGSRGDRPARLPPARARARPLSRRLRTAAGFLAPLFLLACADRPEPPTRGAVAPPFELLDLDGRPWGLTDFAGKVVVLNFWATWCPPCVEEMPSLQRLEDLLGDEGLAVVAVSVDERHSDIGPFVADHRLRFLVLHDLGKRVSRRYEIHQFPETWIVARDGTLASHIVGARDWAAPGSLEIFRGLLERGRQVTRSSAPEASGQERPVAERP